MSTTSNHNLDSNRNLTFFVDSTQIRGFDAAPDDNATDRDIKPGTQRSLGIQAHDLLPGEYHATLRFLGTNSAEDDSQKFNLVVIVRDSWVIAVLVLLAALLFSFVANKLLKSKQAQAKLQQSIRDATPAWLATEDPVLPVVWVQATLRQIQDLAKRFWLTGQSVLSARLDQAQKMLHILSDVRQLRKDIQSAKIPRFMLTHVRELLGRIIAQIGPDSLDDAKTAQIDGQLDSLRAWADPLRRNDSCWSDVLAIGTALLAEVDEAAVPQAGRDTFTTLRDKVKAALAAGAPAGPDQVKQLEQLDMNVAKLRILWDRRASSDFGVLVALLQQGASSESFLQTADVLAWQWIKQTGLTIVFAEQNSPDPIQSFTLLNFYVTSQDSAMNKSFFFHHMLSFEWEFLLVTTGLRRKRRTLTLTPRTLGPRIVQYMPRNGVLRVSVTVKHKENGSVTAEAGPMEIKNSSNFGYFTGLERIEIYSTLLAAFIAIVTGLGTFYFKNTAWGSFQDYLTLFIWGAGVDQGKDFLQNLQSPSTSQ
jgi:hypothetical protein